MKIAVHVIGCRQVGPDDYQRRVTTYQFDSSQTLDEVLAATNQSDISMLNFSNIQIGEKDASGTGEHSRAEY